MREAYKWGAKQYLASMIIGETRKDDGTYSWRGMQQIACRLSDEFGSKWKFETTLCGRYVTRVK